MIMIEDLRQDILNSDVIYALTRNLPNPELQSDVTLNDSDKTFTVPADEIWEILWIFVAFSTSSIADIRWLKINIFDDSSVQIDSIIPGIDHSENLEIFYTFAENMPQSTAIFANDHIYHPLPKIVLPTGYQIQVVDDSGVDPTHDDMKVHIMLNRYDVP